MIITKMAISRRTVLRGLGTSLALPFLDAMMPAFTASAKIAAPLRFSVVYIAHGICVGNWVPAAEGTDYEMTMPMRPLEKFRDRMLLLTGIDNDVALTRPGDPRGDTGGWPPRSCAAFTRSPHREPISAWASRSIRSLPTRSAGTRPCRHCR